MSSVSSASSLMGIDGVSRARNEAQTLLDVEGGERHEQYGSTGTNTPIPRKPDSKLTKRIKYYIPSTAWIPDYSISLLGGDLLAGLTVACMLIPQSVSYASSLAQLNPVTGLFAASIPGIVYAFLGTSRQLNVAPEAALSLMLGQAVADIRHDFPDPHSGDADELGLSVATVITLQVGLISFLLGVFRLGFIDVVLSRALLQGFIAAAAVVIMVEQLMPMLGLSALMHQVHPETTLDKFIFILENAFTHGHRLTALISVTAVIVLLLLRWLKNAGKKYWFIHRMPEVLIVVVVSTIMCYQFGWDTDGVDILGHVSISTGESFIQLPLRASNVRYLRRTTSTAVLISVVGFLDSIVAAKQNGARFGYSISPNRELVALGASNLVASFVPGTLPAYGSITRSRINGDVGGRTQMASLACSGIILLTTFFLLPWMHYLPKCVLGSIISLVVFSLLAETPHELRYYWKMSAWVDLSLLSLTFILSMIWNVEVGIVVGLILSLLLVVHRSAKTRMTILGRVPGTDRWKPINENPEAEEDLPGVLIVRIREKLDFANTAQLKDRLRRLELYGIERSHPSEDPRRPRASVLVFHMADVESIDASAAQIFSELVEEYKSRGVKIFITHLCPKSHRTLEKAGVIKLLDSEELQATVADAIAKVEQSRWAQPIPLIP
ncbi:SLC26A/SulP transporter family protein [Pleurotus pulmonarius]